jgi:murein DD-endopeptidase MepM/ murein hydrolase activator NlpD
MDTTRTRHRVRTAGAGLLGSLLLAGFGAAPATAATAPVEPQGWGLGPVIPQLADPFVPIIDIDALRAEEERKEAAARRAKAEEKRQRAEARRRKAEEADRKRRAQKVVPVESYDLTARFGQGGGYWSGGRHTGLDFAAAQGTDVRAALAGTVAVVGWQGSYGNRIEISHPDGTVTTYSHLSGIGVNRGEQVSAGEVIGAMGSTGNATGTHLHFEVIAPSGSFVDPATWLGLG